MKVAIVMLTGAVLCHAQTTVNGGRVYLGTLKADGSTSSVDFTTAGSTAPVKTGPLGSRASACTQGEFYFASDSPAGQNLSFCVTTGNPGVWSTISGGGASGAGISYCAPSGSNGAAYSCTPNPAVTYTTGLTLALVPDVDGVGGATTLNANSLGAKPVTLADGATNPAAGDLNAGRLYLLTYDGAAFRLGGGSGGGISSMFFIGTGGGQTLSAGGTTRNFLISGASSFNTSVGPIQVGVPKAGTLKNLRVNVATASGGGSGSCTVQVNGINSSLSAVLPADGATAWRADTTHTTSVNTGDLLSLSCSSGSANPLSIFGILLELQYSGGDGGGGSIAGGTPGGNNGQLQYNNAGTFAGQSPVLNGGGSMNVLQRGIETAYTTLTQGTNLTLPAQAGAYAVTLATNVPCSIRWEHAIISVTASFTGGAGGLKGKLQHGSTDLTPSFDLTQAGGDIRFYYDHPAPVCLGSGNAELAFVFNGDGVNNLSAYTAGAVTVEVAGYGAR